MNAALTCYLGPASDHNDRAQAVVTRLAEALAARLGVAPIEVGRPVPADPQDWEVELGRALGDLRALAARIRSVVAAGAFPVSAITRCAAAMATAPAVLAAHPGAAVVWLDAHGDLNTPTTSRSGFLGGMPFAAALGLWDSGLGSASEAPALLVGARSLDAAERALVESGRVTLLPPGPGIAGRLADALGDRTAYVHLDCDVLEPGLIATDYAVPNGLGLDELHACAEVLGAHVIGVEIAEYEGDREATAADLVDALAPLLVPPEVRAGR